jgi:hypothetical protein
MVLKIAASVVAMVAGYYLNKLIRGWYQRYQDGKNKKESTTARKDTSGTQQRLDGEYAKLKEKTGNL